ncbi:hypothetical protein ACH5RR_023493 [Cinchona calisaya]|uniref:DNA-binding bromodomain-containing protein n=1 Tax=Cinchona calisaya TaxID=153742 RepID=A0ABD2ZAU8_9GENT
MYVNIIWVKINIMSNAADVDTKELTWSTWEELLLAFAVKRHGLKDWDTVAMELQNRSRSSLPPTLFTPQICKNKYRNLKRRFTNHHNTTPPAAGGGSGGGRDENNELPSVAQSDDDENENENDGVVGGDSGGDSIPWLEELRKLRVAELKQEVHRYDLSIRSLQMKVKTMEEDREKSLNDDQNGDVKQPDLDEEVKQERSENDKIDDKDTPEEVAGKSVSGDNDENISFNESNSAESKRVGFKTGPAEVKLESERKPVGGEVSCNDSSASQEREKGGGDSGELRDSVGESKEGTKDSSDVQSSVSWLTKKRKQRGGGVDDRDGAAVLSPATVPIKREGGEVVTVKSQPSVAAAGFLDKIRSHKHGSVFERRLESQKTQKYKSTIRRHVDIETVQARLDGGYYSLCPTKFYVDLLLLFTNAIVFFPKSSTESLAAEELRQLVMKELKNSSSDPLPEPISVNQKPKPKPERSDSLVAQHKSTNSIIVGHKRSSISAKPSSLSANNVEKLPLNSKTLIKSPLSTSNEDEDSAKLKIKEKPVTGVRSMRRSSKGRPNISKLPEPTPNTSSNNKSSSSQQQQPGSKDKRDKAEAAKGDKKKSEATTAGTKKSGAADFLKRIKKNSPAKGTLVEALKSSRDISSNKGGKKDPPKKKQDEKKDEPVRRSGGGGGGRKQAKEVSSPSKRNGGRPTKKGKDPVVTGGKRGREGGEGEGSSKRPKKRSR